MPTGRGSRQKTNDFKPMWGEAFADLLAPYRFWGYMQEDVLLGDLRGSLDERLLHTNDVLSPVAPARFSSGMFMLFRNEPRVTRLWRSSRDANRVLTSPSYLVFGARAHGTRKKRSHVSSR